MTNRQTAPALHFRVVVFHTAHLLLVLSLASSASGATQSPTEDRVLAALIDFIDVDVAERRFSKLDIENLLIHNDDSLREFIWETSRHQLRLNVDVRDWITINKRTVDYGPDTRSRWLIAHDALDELSYFADLGEYDKVLLFVHPVPGGNPGCGYYPQNGWTTPNGVFDLKVVTLSGRDMGCVRKGRTAHEYGHTLGFPHSYAVSSGRPVNSTVDCVRELPISVSLTDPAFRKAAYPETCFDTWIVANRDPDMMGGDRDEMYEMYFPFQYQAVWQAQAGWIPEEQVIRAEASGTYEITTLERLDSRPKAVRLLIGNDDRNDPVYYWLQTREFSPWTNLNATGRAQLTPCQVDVRLQTWRSGYGPLDRGNTFSFMMSSSNPDVERESIIRRGSPFYDPYRGIFMEMLGCSVDLDERSAEVEIAVTYTDLEVGPSVVAYFSTDQQSSIVDLSNDGVASVNVGTVSVAGRNASAFVVDADGCGNRQLGSGESCAITVTYVPEQRGPYMSYAVLMIENDDEIAPRLTVDLLADP